MEALYGVREEKKLRGQEKIHRRGEEEENKEIKLNVP